MLLLQKINKIVAWPFLKIIRLYQHTLSPDQGWLKVYHPYGFCPYYPHCSEYGYQALEKYGFFPGAFKSLYRVLRCHPLAKGGPDPLL